MYKVASANLLSVSASLTIPTGAVSIITASKFFLSQSNKSLSLGSNSISAGLGGMGPQGNTYKLGIDSIGIGRLSSAALPNRKLVSPGLLDMFNWARTFGLRISNSRMIVFLPASAIREPAFVLMKDFPSPLNEEVTNMTGL